MALALPSADLAELHERARSAFPDYLADLQTLVDIDSGTYTKSGVDAVSGWMMQRLEGLGATTLSHPHPELGETRVATFEYQGDGPTLLLVGHADTVFGAGTVGERPFSVADGRAFGPGVADMKSGLLSGLYALSILRDLTRGGRESLLPGRVIFVVNPDEEIGSPASSPIIEALSAEADVALVLEGARPNGDIVSARAGMMHLRITIEGRAAHAGVEPDKGRSAVLEASHLIVALSGLARGRDGVTVNVGEVRGGTRPNIVAAEAALTLDVRTETAAEQDEVEAAIRELAASPTIGGTSSVVEVLARSRPMESTATTGALVEMGREIAAGLGFALADTSSRGASDGNITAGAGVPTLDGCGPIGGFPHSADEYLDLESVPPRKAWLAGMLAELGLSLAGSRQTG